MSGMYGGYSKKNMRGYGGLSRSLADQDFHEDEVWDVYNDHREDCYPPRNGEDFSAVKSRKSSTQSRTPQSSLPRVISRANSITYPVKVAQHSVPVSIPDWSKIYGQSSSVKGYKRASFNRGDEDEYGSGMSDVDKVYELPPHEWLDRKLSRGKMSSFSVVEGAGRTLKGRDLSKVRDSVLTRTGFLE